MARHQICHAPFSSINFTQNGDMRACCYNLKDVLGTYPAQSIKEAWEGTAANKLRGYMKGSKLANGCEGCWEQIVSGNYLGSKAIYYDQYASLRSILPIRPLPPKVFEFELSNTCNLECIMCNGYFSSAIRANREKLPKLHSPFDAEFVNQVKEYLPYLSDAKFLGGEPFMISQYYEIWDAIIAINPKVKVHITTNGTVLNKRAKESLEKMNAAIIVSVDSVNKENYEKIRVNGDFEVLMQNMQWFLDYRTRKNSFLGFAISPIISNRLYLAEIIRYCNENDIYVHFNTVWDPKEECLRYTSTKNLQRLIDDLSEITYGDSDAQKVNEERTKSLLAHLDSWHNEQDNDTKNIQLIVSQLQHSNIHGLDNDTKLILQEIISSYDTWLREEYINIESNNYLGRKLERIADEIGYISFNKSFWACVLFAAETTLDDTDYKKIKTNIEELLSITESIDQQAFNRQILLRNFDFITILKTMKGLSSEEIKKIPSQLLST